MKKAFVLGLLLSLFSLTGIAQTESEKYPLSSHILDINVGKPAALPDLKQSVRMQHRSFP